MTTPQTNIKTQLTELVGDAFEAYCEDIGGMFGVDMDSSLSDGTPQTVKETQKPFKKLSAAITIRAKGILEGNFYILYDREALFTLAGTIVMLPEERIKSFRKTGTVKDAEELQDAVGETGNLLVGSWDRIFRENLEGHEHFLQTGTIIGNLWDNVSQSFGLSEDEEFLFFPCEMTIGTFDTFHCGVIFPEAIFSPASETTAIDSEENINPTVEDEEQVQEASVAEADEASEPAPIPKSDDISESVLPEIVEEDEDTAQHELPGMPVAEQSETSETARSHNETSAPSDDSDENSSGTVSQTIQEMVQSLPILPEEQAKTLLSVPVKDIMNTQILWANPDDSVLKTMEKMQEADAACVLVGTPDNLEGIITWIDIAEAVSIYLRPVFSKWHRPADDATLQIKIKIIMTRLVRTVPTMTPLSVIMEKMCQHRMRSLPVVDDNGNIQGVVSVMDIFKALLRTDPDFKLTNQKPLSDESPAS